jgi:hypothetical protein
MSMYVHGVGLVRALGEGGMGHGELGSMLKRCAHVRDQSIDFSVFFKFHDLKIAKQSKLKCKKS